MTRRIPLVMSLVLAMAAAAAAQAVVPSGFVEESFTGVSGSSTAMAFAPDGRLFVCGKDGTLRSYSSTGAFLGIFHTFANVDVTQERGLLGIAFHPDFAANRWIYVYVTRTVPAMHNEIVRITESGNASTGVETVILALEDVSFAIHNAGGIRFGPDGKLYIAVGDNGPMANSQSLATRFGKILRINADGSIPSDNPSSFTVLDATGAASTASPTGDFGSIWAIGLRNPFRFAFQPGTGRMFINDVGQGAWEEINDGVAGGNYGWRATGTDGPTANTSDRDPLYAYGHTGTTPAGRAITGGTFYNPTTTSFPNGYVGFYFFADYTNGWIWICNPSTGAVSPFATGMSSIVDLAVGSDGALYVLRLPVGVRRIRFTGTTVQALDVSVADLDVPEGGAAALTVRLATDPGPTPVTVQVAAAVGDASVDVSGPATFTFTTANWSVPQTVTLAAAVDADSTDDGRTIEVSAPGLATRTVIATAMDADRPPGSPSARITMPVNGATVSGTPSEFFGEGFDDSTTVRAEFYIDGVLDYSEPNTVGHYHFGGGHAGWNTTALANGVHVLRLVVYDDTAPVQLAGGHEITIVVDNPVLPPAPPPPAPAGDGGGRGRCGLTGIEPVIFLVIVGAMRARRAA